MNLCNAGSFNAQSTLVDQENKEYSLEDLFALESAQLENNIYEMI